MTCGVLLLRTVNQSSLMYIGINSDERLVPAVTRLESVALHTACGAPLKSDAHCEADAILV